MSDMLVNLTDLPNVTELEQSLAARGIILKRPIAPEKSVLLNWVRENFETAWADECDVAFSNWPVSAYMAIKDGKIIGFACYEATCRNFFGPTGVLPEYRGEGVGKALFLKSVWGLKELGYAYCIIGAPGPQEFYRKSVGAVPTGFEGRGIYKNMVR